VPLVEDPNILVATATRDDGAVYRIGPGRALVATTDFFTPIVDDPADWGAIACANALSDVYAMGGKPLFALNIVGWPRDTLPLDLLAEVVAGGNEIALEAGCPVIGGHTVDDPEPKFGFAVTGEVDPDNMLTNAAGRPGDFLVLTKPLGTGILTTALKRGLIGQAEVAEAVGSMRRLNRDAAEVALGGGVSAATDVTGFGLLGHLNSLALASGVSAEIWLDRLPELAGARELAADGVVPGGSARNLESLSAVDWGRGVDDTARWLAVDAQTSGGLLLAVDPGAVERVVEGLGSAGCLARAVVGRLGPGVPGHLDVRASGPER